MRAASLLLCLCALLACQGYVTPRAREAPAGRGVSAAAFFRNPVLDRVTLSPDGQRIAALSALEGVPVIVETPLRNPAVRFLKKIDEPGMWVRTLGWSGDQVILVGFDRPHTATVDRVRKSRILALRIDGLRPRDYGKSWTYQTFAQLADGIIHWLPGDPDHVLVNWWTSAREGASAERVSVRSGVRDVAVEAQPWVDVWHADHRGEVRAGTGTRPEGTARVVYARRTPGAPFEELVDTDLEREDQLEFAGFSADPGVLYVRAVAANGRRAIFEYDLARAERGRLVFAHPEVDVGALVQASDDGRLLAVEFEHERPSLHFVDEAAAREQEALDALFPDAVVRGVGPSAPGATRLVRVSGDTTPPRYYAYEPPSKRLTALPAPYPDLDPARLSPTRALRYAARDGHEIPAYLTVPRDAGPGPLPVIVIPHGGPSERSRWGWDAGVQFLAARGFAVFQPDFRGSTGYGRDHELAGHGQWGLAMQDDLSDGVRWLVAEGIADPQRVGIYGVGYGGYAALMGLVKTPQLFRAGASFGGLTDLVALLEDPEQYRSDDPNHPVPGDLPRHRAQLEATSPARQAARIRAPVLLAHGADDTIVHPDQFRAMREALDDAGVRAETYLYRSEPNRFLDERNRIDFHERLAAFFERHLAALEAL